MEIEDSEKEEEYLRLVELRNRIFKEKGSLYCYKKITERVHFLKDEKKYSDSFLFRTLAFHVFIISTPQIKRIERIDLIGEDSFESFVSKL